MRQGWCWLKLHLFEMRWACDVTSFMICVIWHALSLNYDYNRARHLPEWMVGGEPRIRMKAWKNLQTSSRGSWLVIFTRGFNCCMFYPRSLSHNMVGCICAWTIGNVSMMSSYTRILMDMKHTTRLFHMYIILSIMFWWGWQVDILGS